MMPDETVSPQIRDRYRQLLTDLMDRYLNGEFLSGEMVQDALQASLDQLMTMGEVPRGERVEQALAELQHTLATQQQAAAGEVQQAKAGRRLKAHKLLEQSWAALQAQYQARNVIATAVDAIATAPPATQLVVLITILDPNRAPALDVKQLATLAQTLQQRAASISTEQTLAELATGLTRGLASHRKLQSELMGWAFDRPQRDTGFGQGPNPWEFWAQQLAPPPASTSAATVGFFAVDTAPTVPPTLVQSCLRAIGAAHADLAAWAAQQTQASTADWVELMVLLQFLQRGLVQWFDNQAYDPKVGPKLSIATFWTFIRLWCALAQGCRAPSPTLADACFQLALQGLRTFAQQTYFPLYGGVFASFAGGYLRTTLDYLDLPLNQLEGTTEKARILTLLGYSQRALGQDQAALRFHQEALELARSAPDSPCEIANLNHLSRTCIALADYEAAIDHSQRALLLSRQTGDRLGEVNALANLGYSQVFTAQQPEAEMGAGAIAYLQRGLKLAGQFGDVQSQALCHTSLGMAYLRQVQPQMALPELQAGLAVAHRSGDLYLRGLNCAQLAAAHHALEDWPATIHYGCLGLYLLHQIQAAEWRQPAQLLLKLQAQMGVEQFDERLRGVRSQLLPEIGVDGYDALRPLLVSAT